MNSFIRLPKINILSRLLAVSSRRQSSKSFDGEGVFNIPYDIREPPIPEYKQKAGETFEVKKARVQYQSRKRGMLENDLLLSNFASIYLHKMTPEQLDMYDIIINKPDNDWDIYYWITGKKDVPTEYDNEVMKMMKEYAKNVNMEDRTRMPSLKN